MGHGNGVNVQLFYTIACPGRFSLFFSLQSVSFGGFFISAKWFYPTYRVLKELPDHFSMKCLCLNKIFIYCTVCSLARLFAKLPWPGEAIFAIFESSCHLLLTVEPLKVRGNLVKCLAQGPNKRTSRPIFTLSLFNAERQAGKLWISTF